MNPEQLIEIQVLAQSLDLLDYYQVLKIDSAAKPEDVKRAYHNESRNFHPDRFYGIGNDELKADIHRIAKRITEAYTVLRDNEKRTYYTQLISGADRDKNLRYTEKHEELRVQAKQAQAGRTPQGRQFFQQGLEFARNKEWAKARQAFQSAIMFERDNAVFKAALDKVKQAEAEATAAATGTPSNPATPQTKA